MSHKQRLYSLGIWGLGLGYYLFYTPYSGLTKALSSGIFPGVEPVPGAVLLPASVIATAAVMFGFITVVGWWKYAGRRELFGVSVPCPQGLTFLSGICMATIIGTTTLAFTFAGASIVFVLVLLRGGVLVIAPTVDAISRRRVRWFSWAAMLISLAAVLVVLADVANYKLGLAAAADVSAYLAAYFFKLQFMTKLSKSDEQGAAIRYFVEEQMVATPLLLLALGTLAVVGVGDTMMGFRLGFTTFLGSGAAVGLALLVGLFYACLCVCTTFIFLDRRENTFCVPMHCGSSMLSGVTAAYVLAIFYNQPTPSAAQLLSAGLIIVALLFLSPLHHASRQLNRLKAWLARSVDGRDAAHAPAHAQTGRLLFVCSGNTCRSPMAEAVSNAEIAARLNVSPHALDELNLRSLSAGLSAQTGAEMTAEAQQALRTLGVSPHAHSARALTAELVAQAQSVFCMTSAHRSALIDMIPSATAKTQCLDPSGDIEDPIGKGMDAYVNCARRVRELVRMRLDQLGLHAPPRA